MTTLFISDLHLEAGQPEIGEQFLSFLAGEARAAEALYILGDLFEAWLGDDDPNPYYGDMKSALRELSETGVPVYFMHGNRDFMIGPDFASEAGLTILEDPTVVDLYGEKVLLCHGDSLCTDDVEYQQAMTRDPQWQAMILAKSIEERIALAIQARKASMERSELLSDEIMDVNQNAVAAALAERGVEVMLHGHTHRPAVHSLDLGDRTATRIVLGDWFTQGSVVRWVARDWKSCPDNQGIVRLWSGSSGVKSKFRVWLRNKRRLDRLEFSQSLLDHFIVNTAFGLRERDVVFEMPRFRGQQPTIEFTQLLRQSRRDSREPFAGTSFDQRADE